MTNFDLIRGLIAAQHDTNCKLVGPDWHTRSLDWITAVDLELGEAIDHLGWKWWAPKEPDMPQFHLELIDVLHFAFSLTLETQLERSFREAYENPETVSITMTAGIVGSGLDQAAAGRNPTKAELIQFIRGIKRQVLTGNGVPWADLMQLVLDSGLSVPDIYNTFVAKKALNEFRKQHGYKEGTYVKIWNVSVMGELCAEDNDVLNAVLVGLIHHNRLSCIVRLDVDVLIHELELLYPGTQS